MSGRPQNRSAIEAEPRAMKCVALDASKDHITAEISSAEQTKVHTHVRPRRPRSRNGGTNAISLHEHGKGNLGAKPKAEVVADILARIKERRA